MNKTYRSIWNPSLGCYVAAPECAATHAAGTSRKRVARANPLMRSKSVMALESRVLFDGAMLATAIEQDSAPPAPEIPDVEIDEPAEAAAQAPAIEPAPLAVAADPTMDPAAATEPATDTAVVTPPASDDTHITPPAVEPAVATSQEIVFVDGRVTDPTAFEGEGREVIVLSVEQDGLSQIAGALAGRTDIDAIHIVSHGSDGLLTLGSTEVTAASIQSTQQDYLQSIGQALSADGDILIYACDYAAGSAGLESMQLIADITGADVAASSDATGHESLGADWTLEQTTGEVEVQALAPLSWMNALDFTFTGAGTVGAVGMANNIMGAGVTVVSATYQGGATQSGTFSTGSGVTFGSDILGFTSGTILSTGTSAAGVAGPNSATDYGDDVVGGVDGDPALDAMAGMATLDAAILNIDFIPDVPPGGNVGDVGRMTLEIVFGSDEYLEYIGQINDVMEVTVNGQVVSLVPNASGGESTIGINSVNNTANPALFIDNTAGTYNTQMDAFTVTIPMVFDVIVGQTNTIRLAVADASDAFLDSWMFIRADSAQTVVVAENDQVSTAANLPITVDLTANDYSLAGGTMTLTHIQGDPVTQGQVITLGSGIQLTVGSGGQVTVTGNGSSAANDTFTYQVSNGMGGVASATVNVDVTAPNLNPPVAQDDVEAVLADATLSDSVLTDNGNGADTDPNGNPLSVVQVNLTGFTAGTPFALPSGALLTMNANGTYVYDTNGAFAGLADGATTVDSFSYTVTDGQGGNDTATVNVTVTGVSVAPTVLDLDGNDSSGATGMSTTYGPNLVTNGDFGAGNSGFTSDYVALADTSGLWVAGTYYVGIASDVWMVTGQDNIATDPFGDPDGPVMYVNGSPNPGDVYWSQTFTVEANTDYDLSVWATNANGWSGSTGTGDADPLFELVVNGSAVASGQLSYLTAGQWEKFTGTWNSGSATSVTISMLSASTAQSGNDLAIASFSFSEVLARTAANYETTFTEDGPAVAIADGDTLIASAASQMESAQISLTNAMAGDTLWIEGALPVGISGSVSTALDGRITVTLNGTASRVDYETAIEAIRFSNSSDAPDTADRRIEVLVTDAGGNSNLAQTTVYLVAVNDAPVAVDDSYLANEDDALSLGVLTLNDSDVDGNMAGVDYYRGGALDPADYPVIASYQLLANWTSNSGDGTAGGLDGRQVDTDVVQNVSSLTAGSGVTITGNAIRQAVDVSGLNSASLAEARSNGDYIDVSFTTLDTVIDISEIAFSVLDSNGLGGGYTVTVELLPEGDPAQALTLTASHTLPASPAPGAGVWDQFAVDANHLLSPQTSYTVRFYLYGNPSDDTAEFNDLHLLYNDRGAQDINALATGDQGGFFGFDDSGGLIFNPNGDFDDLREGESRDTHWVYTLFDAEGASDTATVTVTVQGVNDAPVGADDAFDADEDGGFSLGSPVANDTDPDSSWLYMSLNGLTGTNGGSFSADDSGNLIFIAGTDFDDLNVGETRQTSYTYNVNDAEGAQSAATVLVTVHGNNDGPVGGDDSFTVLEDDAVSLGSLTDNDSDVDSDSIQVDTSSVTTGDNGGQFSFDDGGNLIFNPDGDFNDLGEGESRATRFNYTLFDEQGASSLATVTVTVLGMNDSPIAVDDSFVGYEDSSITLGSLLANDSDADGDELYADIAGAPGSAGGVFTVDDSLQLTFDPAGDFEDLAAGETRQTSFTYTVNDNHGGSMQAVVTVTVTGANDSPEALDDHFDAGSHVAVSLGSPLLNDSDIESDALSLGDVLAGTGTNGGTFGVDDGGNLSFDPAGAFDDLAIGDTRDTSFTYSVADGQGGLDSATVTVTVHGEQAPDPQDPENIEAPSYPNEVVFVDAQIPDPQAFAIAGREVIQLAADQDGLAQIAAALSARSGIDAVHIVSHGGDGYLTLGSGTVDANSMETIHLAALQTLAQALSVDGDILIYACDFASGPTGQNTLQLLAQYTVADVAASLGTTGHETLNGNWSLEMTVGSVEAVALAPVGWVHTLNLGGAPVVQGASEAVVQSSVAPSPVVQSPAVQTVMAAAVDGVAPVGLGTVIPLDNSGNVTGFAALGAARLVSLEDVFRQTLTPFMTARTDTQALTDSGAELQWTLSGIDTGTDSVAATASAEPTGWLPTVQWLDDSLVDEVAANADPMEPQAVDVDALQLPRQQAAPGFAAQLARWSLGTAQRPIIRATARA